jgi:hypothetical protein
MKFKVILFCFLLSGCALTRSTVTVHDVVLLPEERIFTVPAGQLINVALDGKPMQMTFPHPMKLVYESVLVRKEEQLNNEILKTAKANKDRKQAIGIFGSVLSAVAGALWIWARRKRPVTINATAKVEA